MAVLLMSISYPRSMQLPQDSAYTCALSLRAANNWQILNSSFVLAIAIQSRVYYVNL